MYDKLLLRWKNNRLTEAQVDLLVLCGWITSDQGDQIKITPKL